MELFNEKEPVVSPRKPLVSFILSIFTPGLGQVYNGQLIKGIILFAMSWIILWLFGYTRWCTYFNGLLLLLILLSACWFYTVLDAVFTAKKLSNYIRKSYNKWYYHLLIALVIIGINQLIDGTAILGIQTYNITSTSGAPTLQVGDLVLVDKKAFTQATPVYGDIVVFKADTGDHLVYRVAGQTNDEISVNGNIAVINNRSMKASSVKDTIIEEYEQQEWEEVLPNGLRHRFYKLKTSMAPEFANTKPIIVPQNALYLLGDNRDFAMDSRYRQSVPTDAVIGKVKFIIFRTSPFAININLDNN
jgi:signal peptidase I